MINTKELEIKHQRIRQIIGLIKPFSHAAGYTIDDRYSETFQLYMSMKNSYKHLAFKNITLKTAKNKPMYKFKEKCPFTENYKTQQKFCK